MKFSDCSSSSKIGKLSYRPSDYWTSQIIMPTIEEESRERAVGRDEVDGFRIDVSKVEGYLKQLILWIRILITAFLVLSLVTIVVWNFFAPTSKDVSDRVIDKLLNAINSENIAGLVAAGDSERKSTILHTSTTPPHRTT